MSTDLELKRTYVEQAIADYEYSWAPEYDKRAMSPRAVAEGTIDVAYDDTERVHLSQDGAWVIARVWIPKSWL